MSSLHNPDAILQSNFFTPFQRGVGIAGHRQEAGRPLCGGLVQAEDTAQLPWPRPLTCKTQSDTARLQLSAGSRTEMIQCWGRISDLYLRSPWAAGAGVVSPRCSAGQSLIPPTDDPWGPGSVQKKRLGSIVHHSHLFISENRSFFVCLNTEHLSPRDWTHKPWDWGPWLAECWTECPLSVP